jgi:hypothetical protein
VKKLHHMIRASKHSTIIWTNHSVIATIIKQTKMITSNIDKLNLRLVRIDMYLSQFDLDIRHKSKRDHVISDALSRLSTFQNDNEKISDNSDNNTLDDINVYVETLIEMFSNFKSRLVSVYKIDKEWFSLYVMLKNVHISTQVSRRRIIDLNDNTSKKSQNTHLDQNHEKIEFERRNDLIYHLNKFIFRARLCISKTMLRNVFKMTHDDLAHADFHRVYVAISKTLYIRHLSYHLRQYIDYCSECLLNQIKRHKFYDVLIFIFSSKISFHIITINFVLTLSQSKQEKFDTLLIVTNKFSKNKLLISKRNTWKTQNWTESLWKYLQLCNWNLSRVIIFDKNVKFRFDMWKSLFKILKTDLLISTIYHSQIDDQSERTNQTIEIALRYLLTSKSDLSWHEILSSLQQKFMNIITFIEHNSNETLYEMNTRSQLTLLNESDVVIENELTRDIIRKDVVDAINFANVRFKVIYDVKYKSLAFNTDDKVYLRLHREYSLSKKDNSKLFNQRSSSYIIKRKFENAVYELIFSQNARIHLVIFIAQLKSAKNDLDLFDRFRSINSKFVETNEDTSSKRSYEVERILKERIRKYEKISVKQFLCKWKDWESKHNTWESKKELRKCQTLDSEIS